MKLFENAKKYYGEAKDILFALADAMPEDKIQGTREANRKSTVRQYNVILQTVMLACAVADGRVCDGEVEFIAALGLENGGVSVDWEALKNYSDEENKQLSEDMTDMVAPVATAFVEKCRLFCESQKDIYERLDALTCLILNEFCSADGQMTKEEYAAGTAVLDSFVKSNWKLISVTPLASNNNVNIKRSVRVTINGEEITDPDVINAILGGGGININGNGITVEGGSRVIVGNGGGISVGGNGNNIKIGGNGGITIGGNGESAEGGLIGALGGLLDAIGGISSAKGGASNGDRPLIPRGAKANGIADRGISGAGNGASQARPKLPPLNLNTNDNKLLNYAKNRKDYTNGVIFIRTGVGEGSGFVLTKDGYAATNAHVVGDERAVKVRFAAPLAPQGFINAIVIAKDTVHDLAIIKLDINEYHHCEIDCSGLEAEIGSEVALLGFPLGSNLTDNVEELNISLARGYVSSNQTRNNQRTTFLDIKAFHGNSGGPIVSLESGLIIGVLVGAVLDQAGGLTMMIPVRYLRELVEKLK
ncbi:MAG: trypsin-like peptidase domain-containing protein [Clostridia bacterium]|nr:trypsin-like peptidase domain-containing protein [Clostridia bacterium]